MRSLAAWAAASARASCWPRSDAALAASDALIFAPCSPARRTLAASSCELVDAELGAERAERLPRRLAPGPGLGQADAQLGEGPAVAGVGRRRQGRLGAGRAGQQHVDQVEVGRQRVAHAVATGAGGVAQQHVGQEEPADTEAQRGHAPRVRSGTATPAAAATAANRIGVRQADDGRGQLLDGVALDRPVGHPQVGLARGRRRARRPRAPAHGPPPAGVGDASPRPATVGRGRSRAASAAASGTRRANDGPQRSAAGRGRCRRRARARRSRRPPAHEALGHGDARHAVHARQRREEQPADDEQHDLADGVVVGLEVRAGEDEEAAGEGQHAAGDHRRPTCASWPGRSRSACASSPRRGRTRRADRAGARGRGPPSRRR